jgi:glycopeptide antibiotics resistance protein
VIVGGIERWIPVVVVSVLVLPLGVLVGLGLIRWRERRGVPDAGRRTVAEVAMVVTTLPWLWMILTPLDGPGSVRLVPFVDLVSVMAADGWVVLAQIGGNLLVFAGFGAFAPMRWRLSALQVIGLAALASGLVEAGQYVFELGRVSSVDDVLLNAAGAGIGTLFGTVIRGTRPQSMGAT